MSNDFEIPEVTSPATKSKKAAPLPPESEAKPDLDVKPTPKVEKPKYSEAELLSIFDEIVFSGEYQEDVNIKGKLNVTFKTRTSAQISDITSKLDSTPANLRSTVEERRMVMNLTYALMKYQGKDISNAKHEDKEKFIGSLSAPIIGVMMVALGKFDEKVYEACKVGEENF